jgi:flagellar biosynthesis/type III secretory pathway M-ring protein FliF/YscJ
LLQTLLRGLLTVGAAALIYMSVVVAARQVREATAAASVETVAGEALEAGAAFAPPAAATVTSQLNPAMRDQLRQIASQDREVVAEGIRTLLHEEVGRR